MKLNFLVIAVLTICFIGNVNAQSKKEQILILSNKLDSLNEVVHRERENFKLETKSHAMLVDSLMGALVSLKIVVESSDVQLKKLNQDFQRKELTINIQKDSLTLIKSEMRKQQMGYDSLQQKKNSESLVSAESLGLPFLGTKDLVEFWLVGYGGGFNVFYGIRIDENKNVWLLKNISYAREDVLEEKSEFYVGKYSSIMKGIGEFDKNEYYRITKDNFVIVDSRGNDLDLSGCCNQHVITETGRDFFCRCSSEFYN